MKQVETVDGEDLSPEEMLKWRQTHIYDAAYQDSLRKDAIAATTKAAVWQQMISKKNSQTSEATRSYSVRPPVFQPPMEVRQDVVTINRTTNTVTLSTESYDRLTKYLAIKSLMVNGQEHEVTCYSASNSDMCKGIIYTDRVCLGVVIDEKDLLPALRECNPEMHFLEAR
ncbi:hypothetical protein MTO96_039006 [Rhipicephalus appendiculatus]